ncbi:hypothetical protein BJ742DRAFT_519795 [Cladochytrium replicatum]|nr:hypothetical protein BJ742DRAFT_519795 [Cladochytrium replicatum]
MQFLVLTSFVLNVAEFLQSSDWNPLLVRRLKHAALAYGLSDYHLLSYESPEIDKKLHTDENDVERLSSVGHAIFVSFFCFDNEVSSPIKSDTFTPVLSNFWVCEQLFPLVFDLLESAQHTERLGWPATWMIRHCWNHLPSELLSHESSFSVHFTPDEFFQRCFLFLVSCPDHQLRSQLYTEAKKFLKAFTQETRAIVYRRLITESPYPSIAAAGLSALKEDIVQCWGKQRKAHVMRAGSHYQVAEVECQNFFEGPFLVSTILDELLDKNSKAYSVEETQKTVWNDDEVFFERHGVLMHVLNLYVFLIMRDKPESNKLGLWNENIVHSIRVKLLDPLKKRVPAIVTALSSEASHEDHDNEHDHKHAQECDCL